MATPETIKQVQELCDQITTDPLATLVANVDWGRINFEGARKDLETIFGIANQLKNLPIDLLPDGELNPLRDCLVPIAQQLEMVRKFTIEQPNAPGARDSILQNLRVQTAQLYSNAQSRMPFLAFQRGDIRRSEEEFSRAVRGAQKLLATTEEEVQGKRVEIDQIITAAREASASVGVATFTADFGTAAIALESGASTWLLWTIILGVLTIVVALAFPFVFPVDGTTYGLHAVQLFTSKLVTLAALFTATIWAGRMYKATKHQAAVSLHRANALKTFQAFVKASSDDATRDAVLLETTRSIFALGNTGLLDGSEATGDGAIRILEIVKSAAGAAKAS